MGVYALGVAVATPVLLAARMQLRSVVAADIEGRLPFSVAAWTRGAALAAALLALGAAAWFAGPGAGWTFFLVAVVRAAEDGGDLFLGLAQRADEWSVVARSQLLHGLGGAAVLGTSLLAISTLVPALAATFCWHCAVTLLHDWPTARRRGAGLGWPGWRAVAAAIRAYLPLGAAAALLSLNAYLPRYAVERFVGLHAVGVFAALAQLALVGNLAVQAVGQAAVAPLSRAHALGAGPFLRALAGLLAFAGLVGLAGVAIAFAAGPTLLALFYRPPFSAFAPELLWLTVAAALTYLTAILGYALVAVGERRAPLRIFAVSAAVSAIASWAAAPLWGMRGAAGALAASWFVAAAGASLGLFFRLSPWRRPAASPKLSGWETPESVRPGGAP